MYVCMHMYIYIYIQGRFADRDSGLGDLGSGRICVEKAVNLGLDDEETVEKD